MQSVCDNLGIETKSNRVDIGVRVELPSVIFSHLTNEYGESIARLSNILGGGVIVQRFDDLIRGQRSTAHRIGQAFITPTLSATPDILHSSINRIKKAVSLL